MSKLWVQNVVEGRTPSVYYQEEEPIKPGSTYIDKSDDALCWNDCGERVLNYVFVLNKVKAILNAKAHPDAPTTYFTGFGTLTLDEQKLMAKNLLIPYTMRLGYYTDEEDIYNTRLLLQKSLGIEKRNLKGRASIVEEMREITFVNYVRKDLMTMDNSKLFAEEVSIMLINFEMFQNYNFIKWLTNEVESQFEFEGYNQENYCINPLDNATLKNDLLEIYNGT